ncbi:MAG: bifunctional RNase H/acid phosphatase [Pseudonocardiaceae bacterium]|nr:bifunctional RNase H/acid phosphatase [Pseudonocardiaceae bacterium]
MRGVWRHSRPHSGVRSVTGPREVIVEADGGSRGNPGPAGYGAVVRAEDGTVLAERSGFLGDTTNNVAEYQGLIAGLRAAADVGAGSVEARLDSKLVVEQMSGRWKIKNEQLRPLALQARDLAAQFETVRYEWVPRARNAHADRLANEAMDGAPGQDQSTAAPNSPVRWTGATGEPTRMLLLRHGQTERSAQRRYSGRDDVRLTAIGEQQALLAAKRLSTMEGLPGAPVITSPLSRAKQTAQAVADATGGELVVHHGFIETDFGSWEGLTFPEAAERDPEVHRQWLGDSSVPTPGGESFDAVLHRVRKGADELIARYPSSTLVVVSHVTPIKQLLRLGLGAGPSLLYRLHLDLASLSIVEFYPDGLASVRLVNDSSHLGS